MEKYKLIVKGVNIVASGSQNNFIDKFPVLLKILSKSKNPLMDWIFFMTVAGVGIYFLTNKSTEKEAIEISEELKKINKQMPQAMDHFFDYVEQQKEAGVNLEAIIGYWVLWNIMNAEPTLEECTALAPAIGVFLSKVVSDLSK